MSGVVSERNERYLYCLNVSLCTKKKETQGKFVLFPLFISLYQYMRSIKGKFLSMGDRALLVFCCHVK